MNWIIIIACWIVGMWLILAPAQSQEVPQVPGQCDTLENVKNYLHNQYGEKEVFNGWTVVGEGEDRRFAEMKLFYNPISPTKNWTLVVVSMLKACAIQVGLEGEMK